MRRGQDDEGTIDRRVNAAREEMRHCDEFDYVIINQEFASAVYDCAAIVRASRLRSASGAARAIDLTAKTMARTTIEDAIAKIPNRFELTLAATNRARQISAGSEPLVDADRDKPTVIALREIAAGKVGIEMLLKP